MKNYTTSEFWQCHRRTAFPKVRLYAWLALFNLKIFDDDSKFEPRKLGQFWSCSVNAFHRALAIEVEGNRVWFWIGSRAEYDQIGF